VFVSAAGMNPKVHRGYEALLAGRWSQGGYTYFLTGCLARPLNGLTSEPLAGMVWGRLHELEATNQWQLRSCVLMPDHFHLLLTLGQEGDLSDVMRHFKGPLTSALRHNGLRWQPRFYDHRLRSADELLPIFLYILLNPYRANLIAPPEKWPWYYCAPEDWKWFGELTNDSVPMPEWLQ
jgi:REP element-mobilizing transposase RayT